MLKHMPPGVVPSTGQPLQQQQQQAQTPQQPQLLGPRQQQQAPPPPRTASLNSTNSNTNNVTTTVVAAHHNSSTSTVSNGSVVLVTGTTAQHHQQPAALPTTSQSSATRPQALVPVAAAGAAAAAIVPTNAVLQQLQPLNVSTIGSSTTSPHSILAPGAAASTAAAAAPASGNASKLLLLANGVGPPPRISGTANHAQQQHAHAATTTTAGPASATTTQTTLGGGGGNNCSSSTVMLNTTPLTSVSSSMMAAGNSCGAGSAIPLPATMMHSCGGCMMAMTTKHRVGAREALTSLGLLCLVSLLLALLSLIFLLKISPGGREPPPPPPGPISSEDYIIVYDVTLALCALSLSLNLCCLLVCAIQFLFAVKLVRAPATSGRSNKYLQKSSVSRVCAVGGFFISIPIFLTGIILYTFTQFHSTPAIITSVLIGFGIVFCGCAMVHNVFVWQKEKTICVRHQNQAHLRVNYALHPANAAAASQHSSHHHSQPANGAVQSGTGICTIMPANGTHYFNHNGNAGGAGGQQHASLQPLTLLHHHHNNYQQHQQQQHNNTTPMNHTPLTHAGSQNTHTTPLPVTPLSPNHSHVSFGGTNNAAAAASVVHNHSAYVSTYGLRPATATPPTPKVMIGNGGNSATVAAAVARDACGSVSPMAMLAQNNGTTAAGGNGTLLELSIVSGAGISPHELSTLV